MSPGRGRKAPATKTNKRTFFRRRKVCKFTAEGIEYIDYKDINLLRRFMSDRAKIRARRVTGNDAQQQREVARAIKNAREMALLPYTNRVTTQRTSRDRGPGGPGRADGPPPRPQGPPPGRDGDDTELDTGFVDVIEGLDDEETELTVDLGDES